MVLERLKSLFGTRWLSESEFQRQLNEVVHRRAVPEFWMLGKTGSGKTSIIRYLTGAEDAEIGNGFRPQTRNSRQYDFPTPENPLLRFVDTRGLGENQYDPTEDIATYDARAHVVIVTARLLDHALAEVVEPLRKIRESRPERPVVLALTCLHEAYPQQQHVTPDPFTSGAWPTDAPDAIRRSLELQQSRFAGLVDRVVPLDFTPADDGFAEPNFGGERLHAALVELLPEAFRQTLVSLDEARRDLRDLHMRRTAPYIAAYSLAAASAAAVPVPWVDIPVVLGIQSTMVYQLARLYGQPADAAELWKIAGPLAGSLLARFAVRELLKMVPLVGLAANAALAYAYTFGLGRACCWYYGQLRDGHLPTAEDVKRIWEEEISVAAKRWNPSTGGPPT